MCGIGGVFFFREGHRESLNIALERMARQMHHRGPDDEGYYVGMPYDDLFCGNRTSSVLKSTQQHISTISQPVEMGLVHRRLAIVDLSVDSHQPMTSSDGRYVITFNGEIYNYKDLANHLRKEGVHLRTHGDTEILLELYALLGASALDLLNGDFAFAIWDKKDKSLFCARDRVGIKPFYYVRDNEKFCFASDIKTLISSSLYTPEVDANGLMLSFAFGMAPRPVTAFKSITALEPGTWIKISRTGVVEEKRYWAIPVGTQDNSITEADAIDAIEAALKKAVKLRTVADVPVGVFMSGGVDSTLVAALSASQNDSVEAYTLGFSNASCIEDEVEEASLVAHHIGIKHNIQRVDPLAYLQEIDQINIGYEEPFYNVSPNYMVSKFVAERKVKVALNGLGGDELFAGYDYYKWCSRWDRFKACRQLAGLGKCWPNSSVRRVSGYLASSSATKLHSLLFLKIPFDDLIDLFQLAEGKLSDPIDFIENLYAVDVPSSNVVDGLSYMDMKNYVGNHHVERIDQFTMMNSIEGRFPFLDHNLIELSYTIPSHLKLRNNEQKYLLRKLSRRFLPKESLDMRKKGFSFPLRSWMKNELAEYVRFNLQELSQIGVFDPSTIARWYNEYQHGKRPYTHIWQLVSTNIWFKTFVSSPMFGEQC